MHIDLGFSLAFLNLIKVDILSIFYWYNSLIQKKNEV